MPVPDGVNTPAGVMVPPVAVQVTAVLYDPVPDTVAEHCDVCPGAMELGAAVTATEVTVAGELPLLPNLRMPEPRFVLSCLEVAVTVTVSVPALAGAV